MLILICGEKESEDLDFFNDNKTNDHNLEYCNKFIEELEELGIDKIKWEGDEATIFMDLPCEKLIPFIDNMKLNDDQLITNENVKSVIKRISSQDKNLKARVCLFSQTDMRTSFWSESIQDKFTSNMKMGTTELTLGSRRLNRISGDANFQQQN